MSDNKITMPGEEAIKLIALSIQQGNIANALGIARDIVDSAQAVWELLQAAQARAEGLETALRESLTKRLKYRNVLDEDRCDDCGQLWTDDVHEEMECQWTWLVVALRAHGDQP